MAIFHAPIKMIQRSAGRSAVAASAYRSGTKMVNEWDGQTHDYTRKHGIIFTEIMLPAHAPPEFADRSKLWNSVEQNEKAINSQLAREMEVALPIELPREAQWQLVRAYVQDTFVSAGMCADIAMHDKGDGNPHAHIMLTVRPLTSNGKWGAKCRKVYDLDEHGQRIPDGKGRWKCHREDTTNWNDWGNAEIWRAAWAEYANRALEENGRPERIDHRSYKRQGIEKIPTIHMGVAATRMERRGIQTVKGDVNRQIEADNKLLKEIKARITRLYNWSKEQSQVDDDKESVIAKLWDARLASNQTDTRYGKIKALKENAQLLNFLTDNGIQSMQQLHEKMTALKDDYYALRREIRSDERRWETLDTHLKMWADYEKYKPLQKRYEAMKPEQQERFFQEHSGEFLVFGKAFQYLKRLQDSGEEITPKRWEAELGQLMVRREKLFDKMKAMREEIRAAENLKKAAEKLAESDPSKKKGAQVL